MKPKIISFFLTREWTHPQKTWEDLLALAKRKKRRNKHGI